MSVEFCPNYLHWPADARSPDEIKIIEEEETPLSVMSLAVFLQMEETQLSPERKRSLDAGFGRLFEGEGAELEPVPDDAILLFSPATCRVIATANMPETRVTVLGHIAFEKSIVRDSCRQDWAQLMMDGTMVFEEWITPRLRMGYRNAK